jgi:pimeloyl-ACP methyl ester carboxylesterase
VNLKTVGCIFIFAVVLLTTCSEGPKNPGPSEKVTSNITSDDYELIKTENSEALLILFPGGGGTSKDTKAEFDISTKAIENDVSVLFMDFNLHFWIDDETAEQLSIDIAEILESNQIKTNKVYLGGFSIGGNVALLLANHLTQTDANLKPTGVFVVDSPIDLNLLYQSARKDISRTDFSEERLAEPRFIIETIENEFGDSSQVLSNIESASPIILETAYTENITALEDCEVRFYTEPDSIWWMENRQTIFENTNSFVIQESVKLLKSKGWHAAELIETKNKGYRANGERHPHSWSIVDIEELIDWILQE